MKVTIIDYDVGNLLSVARAFEFVGAEVEFAQTAENILQAERLVLPGVGAFADGMAGLRQRQFVEPIQEYAARGKPFLGICLGMQMMMDYSEEFGKNAGLKLMPGAVIPVPNKAIDGRSHKIPHIGWNELKRSAAVDDWSGTLLEGLNEQSACYFVHSYMCALENDHQRLADSYYDGQCISAVIQKDNLFGCQFHPEKSGDVGLSIIKNFVNKEF